MASRPSSGSMRAGRSSRSTESTVGTFLPELAVEISAARRGQWDMAVGDAIGSSFIDATLSLGVGPMIAPIALSAGVAVAGSLVAAAAVGLAVLVLVQRREHNQVSGVVLTVVFLVACFLIANVI